MPRNLSIRGYFSFVMAIPSLRGMEWGEGGDYLLSFRRYSELCPVPVRLFTCALAEAKYQSPSRSWSWRWSRSWSRVKNLMRFGMLLGNNSWINAIWLKLISLLAFSAFSGGCCVCDEGGVEEWSGGGARGVFF